MTVMVLGILVVATTAFVTTVQRDDIVTSKAIHHNGSNAQLRFNQLGGGQSDRCSRGCSRCSCTWWILNGIHILVVTVLQMILIVLLLLFWIEHVSDFVA